jgi:hypothetical protein
LQNFIASRVRSLLSGIVVLFSIVSPLVADQSFRPARRDFLVSPDPAAAKILDFNSDGFPDIAVIEGSEDGMLLVFRGSADRELTLSWAIWCGDFPSDLEVVDLNGDSVPDIVVSLEGERLLRSFLGNPQGRFLPSGEVDAGSLPSRLLAADIEGDGMEEVLLGSADRLFIYKSTPEGNLAEFARYPLLDVPSGIAAGYFNEDSFTDVMISYETQGAYIFFGEGDGDIGSGVQLEEEMNDIGSIMDLRAADMDRDGNTDLLVHGSTGGRYHVLWGTGTGSFLNGPVIEPAVTPSIPFIVSFDGGSILDVLSIAPESGVLEAYGGRVCGMLGEILSSSDEFELFGEGGGPAYCFSARGEYRCGSAPIWADTGDFDADGSIDMCVLNRGSGSLSLFFGTGRGLFGQAPVFRASPGTAGAKSVAVLDANEDGLDDVAVSFRWVNEVSILLGDGKGSFDVHGSFPSGGSGTHTLAAADLNEDDHMDLVVRNVGTSSISVLLGDGKGSFALSGEFSADTGTHFVTIVDLDRDGHLDVVTSNARAGTLSIFIGNGTGNLERVQDIPVGSGPHASVVIDFDRDGMPDLATANSSEDSIAILRNVSGALVLVEKVAVGAHPISIASGDFDRDGFPDLATANMEGFTISILWGNGTSSFRPHSEIFAGEGPHYVAAADVNADGHLDLVSPVTGNDCVVVYFGDGAGDFPRREFLGVGDNPNSLAVGDFNSDGKPDVVTANSLSSEISLLLNVTPDPDPRGY